MGVSCTLAQEEAMDIRRAFIVSLVGAALLSVPRGQPAGAQTVGASLQGFITDSTGAAVPNAQVLVLNLSTGAKLVLTRDRAGRDRVPVLPPGECVVHVTATGFQ